MMIGEDPLRYAVEKSQLWVTGYYVYPPTFDEISSLLSYLKIFRDHGVEHNNLSVVEGYATDYLKLTWGILQDHKKEDLKLKIISDFPPVLAKAVEILNQREKMEKIDYLQTRVETAEGRITDTLRELEGLKVDLMGFEEAGKVGIQALQEQHEKEKEAMKITYEKRISQLMTEMKGHPATLKNLLLDVYRLSSAIWEKNHQVMVIVPMMEILNMEFRRKGLLDYADAMQRYHDYYSKKPADKTFEQLKKLGGELETEEPKIDNEFHKFMIAIQLELEKDLESEKGSQPIIPDE